MIQTIDIYDWVIEVDVEKTKKLYKNEREDCSCLYCNNYREASQHLDNCVFDVFNKLGIDPSKPSHLSEFPYEEQFRLYIGSYHIVGRLLKGELSTMSNSNATNTFQIKDFNFGFSIDLQFVPIGFPNPVLQLDFEAKIPWVLDENPEVY